MVKISQSICQADWTLATVYVALGQVGWLQGMRRVGDNGEGRGLEVNVELSRLAGSRMEK